MRNKVKLALGCFALIFVLMWILLAVAEAALTYMDSGQWTFNEDTAVSGGSLATTLSYGLQVWDVSHNGDARFLDDFYFDGARGYAVAWSGNVIAATTVAGGLYLINATSTTDLQLYDLSSGLGSSPDIAISGNYLYSAGNATNDFQVRDISTPASPSVVGNEQCASALNALALAGTHALCTSAAQFYSIDISTPSSPALDDSLAISGTSVAYAGGTAAIGRGSSGFTLVNATSLSALVEGATVTPDAGEWTNLSVSDVILSVTGDTLYAICESGGALMYDVSNIASPALLGYDPALDVVAGDPPYGYFNDGVLNGSSLHLAHWSGGRAGVMQISATVASMDSLGRAEGTDYCRDVAVDHNLIYGCTGSYGVVCHEHIAPDSLVARGRLPLLEVWGAEAHGPIVYIASTTHGLVTSEWNDPDNPTILDELALGQARNVTVQDSVAYVAAFTQGIHTISVADISNLVALDDTVRTGQQSVSIAVVGDLAVTADRGDGLNVWDVSNPANINHWSNYATTGDCLDVALTDDGAYAYVVDEGVGVRILDMANPDAPALVTTFGSSITLSVAADAGYLILYREGLATGYSLADPEAPSSMATLATAHGHETSRVYAKRLGGQFWAYLADYAALTVARLDITTPAWTDYTFREDHPRIYLTPEKIARIQDEHVTPNSSEWQGVVEASNDNDPEGYWAGALRYAVGDYDEAEAEALIDEIVAYITEDPGIVFYSGRKYGCFTAHTSTNDSNPTSGPPGVGDWTDFGPLAASDSTFYSWGGQWWAAGVAYPVNHHIDGNFNRLARLGTDYACIYDWLFNATAMTDSVKLLIRDYVGTVQRTAGASDWFGNWDQYPISESSGQPYFNGTSKSICGYPIWGLASYPDSSGTVSGITEPDFLQSWEDYVSGGFDDRWAWVRPLYGYAGPGGDPVAAWKGGFPAEGRDYGTGTMLGYIRWLNACATAFTDFDPAAEAPYIANWPQAYIYDYFYSTSEYRHWGDPDPVLQQWKYELHPFGDAAHKGDANYAGTAAATWGVLDVFPDAPYANQARWCLQQWPGSSAYPENDEALYGVWSVLWVRNDDPQTQPANIPLQYFSPFQGLWTVKSDWPAYNESPDIYATFRCGNLIWFNQNARDQGAWDLHAYGDWLFIHAGLYDGQGGFPTWVYHQQTVGSNSIRVKRDGDIWAWHPTEGNDSHNAIWVWDGDTVQVNTGGQKFPHYSTFPDTWKDGIAGLDTLSACRQEYIHDAGDIPAKEGNDTYVYALGNFTNAYDNTRWEDEYDAGELATAEYTPRVDNVERSWVYLREDTLIATYDRVSSAQSEYEKFWDLHSIYEPILDGVAVCGQLARGDFGSEKSGPGDYETMSFTVTGDWGGQAKVYWVADWDFSVEKVGSNNDYSGQWYLVNGTDWNPWPLWPGSSGSGALNDRGGHWRMELTPTAPLKVNNLFTLVVPRPSTMDITTSVVACTTPDSLAAFLIPEKDIVLVYSHAEDVELADVYYSMASSATTHYVFGVKPDAWFDLAGSGGWSMTAAPSSSAGVLRFTSSAVTSVTITEH